MVSGVKRIKKNTYHTGKFTFSITDNYADQMETYWDETIANPNGSFGNRIGDKVAEYFVLGANLRIDHLFVKELYLNIRCSNLLNAKIRYPTTTMNQWLDKGTLGKNRTILISMGWKF